MTTDEFDYSTAFSRNIGLITPSEQQEIRNYTIAIAGMGGVGGSHLISLVRQGFEKFKIADIDVFEFKNFNRQFGARIDTVGRNKTDVMKEEALKINPRCQIEIFPNGVTPDNVSEFLHGAHLAVDAIDAFEVDARRTLLNTAHQNGVPAITAGPIGFGTAFLLFSPHGPSFDDYCNMTDTLSYEQKLLRFLIGLVPSLLQRTYMSGTNLEEKRGPSSIAAVNLCSGIVTAYAIKILLRKGKVRYVPYYHQFDIMRERYVTKRLWFGNKHPLQRLKMYLAKYLTKD